MRHKPMFLEETERASKITRWLSLALVLDGEHDEVGLVNQVGGTHEHCIGSAIVTLLVV